MDSAEMTLETFGRSGKAARDLRKAVSKLESKLQEADSERELEKLIEEVQELMEKVEEESSEMMMDEPGMEGPGQGSEGIPDDDMPPM